MDQEIYENLLYSIKSDSLILFSNNIKDQENIKFGRFPILSLCYLYNAKQIIKQYEKILIKINDYKEVDESLTLYKKFKDVAGRSLRLYTKDASIISPIEMLAILHKDRKVKKLFKFCKIFDVLNPDIINNLETIYSIHRQNTKTSELNIKISPRPLNSFQKRTLRNVIAIALSFILSLTGCFILINFSTGLGTSWNPYKIHNEKQFIRALESDANYILTKNLVINEDISDKTLQGYIDGNNYTLEVKALTIDGLIEKNDGKISNLNIIYDELQADCNSSVSLLVSENNGTINNVTISCKNLNLNCHKSSQTDIFISGFATNNNGTIKNCSIDINSKIDSTSSGECVISGIAGTNSGTINNCVINKDSSITSTEGDIAGICGTNTGDGKIVNCINYAALNQTSSSNEWTPTVGGITLSNYGTISNCTNYGKLTNISNNEEEEPKGNIFLGGISALNYGRHTKCLNYGDLTSFSKKIISYVGGVSGYSQYWDNRSNNYPVIDSCGSLGIIDVQSEHEKAYAFAGGLCGSIYYGELTNCYSLSTFANDYTESRLFFGTCVGSAFLQYNIFTSYVCFEASNNYVLSLNNVEYQLGSLIYNSSISKGGDMSEGISTLSTIDQIKSQGVYWDNEK